MASAAASGGISNSGKVFFSSLCASTFGLGCWQSKRYFEKIEQVEQRTNELQMTPTELEKHAKCSLEERYQDQHQHQDQSSVALPEEDGVGTEMKMKDRGHRPIIVKGTFRYEDEVLVGPRGPPFGALSKTGPNSGKSSGGMASSPQGYYLITPLERKQDMGTILVNRGWVPRSYVQDHHPWFRPKGEVSVIGVASKTEQPKFMSPPHNVREPKQLLWMDRKTMEVKTHTDGLAPLLVTETKGNQDEDQVTMTAPFKPSLESVGEFKVTPSTHAGYAFTWFGLSGAGIIMTRKLITRGR